MNDQTLRDALMPFVGTENFTPVSNLVKTRDPRKQRALSVIMNLLSNVLPNTAYYALHWDKLVSVFYKDVKIVKWARLSKDGEKLPLVVSWSDPHNWKQVLWKMFVLTGFTMSSKVELGAAVLSIINIILGNPSTGVEIAVATRIAYRIFVIGYFYQTVIKKSKDATMTLMKDHSIKVDGTHTNFMTAHDAIIQAILKITMQLLAEISYLLPDETLLLTAAAVDAPNFAREMLRTRPAVKDTTCVCKQPCKYDYWYGDNACYIDKDAEKRCKTYGANVFGGIAGTKWTFCDKKNDQDFGKPRMRFIMHGSKKKQRKLREARDRYRAKRLKRMKRRRKSRKLL